MYLPLELENNYSSKLSKITVIPLAISAVFIPSFEQVFACKEVSYVKAVFFENDYSARYRSPCFSLNESQKPLCK